MVRVLMLVMALVAAASVAAQPVSQEERAKRSDEILKKMRQMELANQILPLVMTKEQLKQILPPIEKARANVRDLQNEEFETMRKFEERLDTAIKNATDKGQLPGQALLVEMNRLLMAFSLKRQAAASENVTTVLDVLNKTLNAGQLKAAANSLDLKLFDPSVKPEELTETAKVRFYVGQVLLDPLAYDLLVKMSM
ncbi:MAG: hypothetical protein M9921_04350 [Fimbriimonadaceae bacterium]|nr:hypothetical protein [Chthonomonadaceae bacterium]MCO5296067.1 hypothetical protein [Fimbriimonadaceae bacterium]